MKKESNSVGDNILFFLTIGIVIYGIYSDSPWFVFFIPALLYVVKYFFGHLFKKKEKDISYGSAEFADEKDVYADSSSTSFLLKEMVGKNPLKLLRDVNSGGVIVDGEKSISRDLSFQHLAVVAPTGMGKTQCFALPNVVRKYEGKVGDGNPYGEHDHPLTVIVTDPKGEIFAKTSGEIDYKSEIMVLDFGDPYNSLQYNPLAHARTPDELRNIATTILDIFEADTKGSDPFWSSGARKIIAIILEALSNVPKYNNFSNLIHVLNNFYYDSDGKIPIMDFLLDNIHNEFTISELKGILSNEQKTLNGMISQAKGAVDELVTHDVRMITNKNTFKFSDLRYSYKRTTLYLKLPAGRIRQFRFLLSIFYSQLFNWLLQQPEPKKGDSDIFFILDEFANIGKIPNFTEVLSQIRSKRVSISVILQDISQLESLYGKDEAQTILNNLVTKIYYPGITNNSTLKYISDSLGVTTITNSRGKSKDIDSRNSRPLMTPDEIRQLEMDEQILITSREKPMKIKRTPAYESMDLSMDPTDTNYTPDTEIELLKF